MDDMVNHHIFPLQDAPVKDGRTSKEFPLAGIQKDLGWGGDWCGWCHMKKGVKIIQNQWSFHICLRIGHHFCYKTAMNDGGPIPGRSQGEHQNKKDKRIREDMLWQRSKSFQWHVGQSVWQHGMPRSTPIVALPDHKTRLLISATERSLKCRSTLLRHITSYHQHGVCYPMHSDVVCQDFATISCAHISGQIIIFH